MPKLYLIRTINLSNTQFRYQLVFFVHIYGYIWLAEGWLPLASVAQTKLAVASFAQAMLLSLMLALLPAAVCTTM